MEDDATSDKHSVSCGNRTSSAGRLFEHSRLLVSGNGPGTGPHRPAGGGRREGVESADQSSLPAKPHEVVTRRVSGPSVASCESRTPCACVSFGTRGAVMAVERSVNARRRVEDTCYMLTYSTVQQYREKPLFWRHFLTICRRVGDGLVETLSRKALAASPTASQAALP
jgi:hypothetical protein